MWAWSRPRTMRDWPAFVLLPACHTSRSSFSPLVSVSPTFLLLSLSAHAPSPDVYSLTYVLSSPIYSLLSSLTTPTFKSTRQRPQVRVGKAGEGKEEKSLNQNRFTGLWNLSVPVWGKFFKGNIADLYFVLPLAAQQWFRHTYIHIVKLLYFWLHCVFVAAHRLSLMQQAGVILPCGARVSRCGAFSCCRA